MAATIYTLCAVTALGCAVLLLRAYGSTGTRLLLWGGLCFLGLTVNNLLLIVDLLIVPEINLFMWRNVAALTGMALLTFGLVWETRE